MVIVPYDNNDRNRHYGSCDRNYRNGDYGIKTTNGGYGKEQLQPYWRVWQMTSTTVMMSMANGNNDRNGDYGTCDGNDED